MLHKKVTVVFGVLFAISCGRGQGQVVEEGPPGNIFALSPKQIEVLSEVATQGIVSAFVTRLAAKFGSDESIPIGTKGISLFPKYTELMCMNATTFDFAIEPIGLKYTHTMLTDYEIRGMDKLVDNLDIYVNFSDPDQPVSISWRVDNPLLDVLGDYRMEFGLENAFNTSHEAHNAAFKMEEGFFFFLATAKVLPLNESLRFDNVTISFGTKNMSWIAHWIIETNGLPIYDAEFDLAPVIKNFMETILIPIFDTVTGILPTILNLIFKDCSILDLLQVPTACFNSNLKEIFGGFPMSTSTLTDNDSKKFFFTNWNAFGVNECPAPVEITTPEDATTETTTVPTVPTTIAAAGVLGPETGFLLITTILMYLVTRFVVV